MLLIFVTLSLLFLLFSLVILIALCLCVFRCGLILYGALCASWTWVTKSYFISQLGKFSGTIFTNISLGPLSLLLLGPSECEY